MGTCVTKLPHTCGSSDALQVFENDDGSLSGYCFSCDTYVPHPLGSSATIKDIPEGQRLGKTKDDIKAELAEIRTYKTCDLVTRRLRSSILEAYECKVGLSERDGKTPRLVYFPYTKNGELVGYKVRLLDEKRMWNVRLDNDVDLFGWEQATGKGAKRLIITEGEYDALAGQRILEMYGKQEFNDLYAFVSLPNGAATAAKDIGRVLKKIRKYFPEVSLCFDNDDAGKKATSEVLKLIPDATIINLPAKDLNDALTSNKGKAAHAALVFRHERPRTTNLVLGSLLAEPARVRPTMGYSWPWEGFTKLTRGIRRGETYYFGAGVKMGKSELVDSIIDHIIRVHGLPVFICKPEQDKVKTYQMLVGKAAGKIFHDPEVEFDEEAFDTASPLVGDKAIIVDNYQFVDWDQLKGDIRYAVNTYGCKDIFIDPITCLTSNMEMSVANEFLIKCTAELSAMAKELGFTAYLFCHLNPPKSGDPHERGGKVESVQFTGSRAMMRACNLMVGLEGNKDPDLPENRRNVRRLVLLEDRNLGSTGVVELFWDRSTGLFNEMKQR